MAKMEQKLKWFSESEINGLRSFEPRDGTISCRNCAQLSVLSLRVFFLETLFLCPIEQRYGNVQNT